MKYQVHTRVSCGYLRCVYAYTQECVHGCARTPTCTLPFNILAHPPPTRWARVLRVLSDRASPIPIGLLKQPVDARAWKSRSLASWMHASDAALIIETELVLFLHTRTQNNCSWTFIARMKSHDFILISFFLTVEQNTRRRAGFQTPLSNRHQ